MLSFTARDRRRVFWLVFSLIVLSWTFIKIVLPALPGFPELFGCSSHAIKLSVSLYLIFFACSQPVWGGLVQRFGCNSVLLYSFVITIAGSVVAMLASSLPVYVTGRILEGIGMGAASPIGRTLMVDVFSHKQLTRRIGLIAGTAAVMPAIAPILGSYLMDLIGWRAIFGFLLVLSTAWILAAFRWLPQTRKTPTDKDSISAGRLLEVFYSILKSTHFWGFTLTYATMTGGLLGYYSAMPYWLHTQLGVPQNIFSYLAVPTVGLYVMGLGVSSYLIRKRKAEDILLIGLLLSFVVAAAATALSIMNVTGAAVIIILISIYGFAAGIVSPQANAGVLSRFKRVAPPASALVTLVVFGTASLTSMIAMNLSIRESLWPFAAYLGILSIVGLVAGYSWVCLPFRRSAG